MKIKLAFSSDHFQTILYSVMDYTQDLLMDEEVSTEIQDEMTTFQNLLIAIYEHERYKNRTQFILIMRARQVTLMRWAMEEFIHKKLHDPLMNTDKSIAVQAEAILTLLVGELQELDLHSSFKPKPTFKQATA